MEVHGWSFPITGLTFQVRKVIGGGQCWPIGLQCQPQSLQHFSILAFQHLDLGLGFGTLPYDFALDLDIDIELDNKKMNIETFHFLKVYISPK